jgi:hypothetical protein
MRFLEFFAANIRNPYTRRAMPGNVRAGQEFWRVVRASVWRRSAISSRCVSPCIRNPCRGAGLYYEIRDQLLISAAGAPPSGRCRARRLVMLQRRQRLVRGLRPDPCGDRLPEDLLPLVPEQRGQKCCRVHDAQTGLLRGRRHRWCSPRDLCRLGSRLSFSGIPVLLGGIARTNGEAQDARIV